MKSYHYDNLIRFWLPVFMIVLGGFMAYGIVNMCGNVSKVIDKGFRLDVYHHGRMAVDEFNY